MIMATSGQVQKEGARNLIAEVDPDTFWSILKKMEGSLVQPLVLTVRSGMPKSYKYLTHYGGYYFVTKSKAPIDFSQIAEVIATEKIQLMPQWPNL